MLTFHAIDEMNDEGFDEEEFEQAVGNGRIVRRQRDALGRRKYTVHGVTNDRRSLRAVLRFSDAGDSIVVITVFEGIK